MNQAVPTDARPLTPAERKQARVAEFISKNLGRWLMLRTHQGFDLEMLCDDSVTRRLLEHGGFESELAELIPTLSSEHGAVIDLGANVGFFTCLIGKCQPSARIVAVEPNPTLVDVLRRNLARNNVSATVLAAAIGTQAGATTLRFPENRPSRGTLGTLPNAARFSAIREVDVEVVTWERVFQASGDERVRLIKMDLEGYDVTALTSLSVELAARVDNITCEFNEKRLAQCGSSRLDLNSAPWLDDFEPWVVDCAAVPLRLVSLNDFPTESETLWLRRRN